MLAALTLALLAAPAHASACPELAPVLSALDGRGVCLTPAIRAAWLAAETPSQYACVAAAMAERGLPDRPMAPGRAVDGRRGTMPEKGVRDSYGLPNQAFSEHFVLLWGEDRSPSESQIDNLLDAFETGWDNHIDGWGMPAPEGSDEYYFNVYIGDSGSGAPGISGASGYFTTDGEGNPIIVMDPGLLANRQYASTTAVHEFFHAVQWATNNYVTYDSMWFWESTATWSEGAVYPSYNDYAWPLPGFAFLPFLPLSFFDYPDRGQLQEMHHYGAFIWPRYITEFVADDELTVEVWLDGSAGADPLYIYDEHLYRASGKELVEVWGDFLGHNAVWDYQDRSLYRSILDMYASYYSDQSIASSTSGPGMEDWTSARDNLPQNMGANYLVITDPDPGVLRFEFEGDLRGSSESLAEWEIRMVTIIDGAWEYHTVPVEGGLGSWASDGVTEYDTVYVAVGAWAATWYDEETFDYSFRLWVEGAFGDTGLSDDTGVKEKPGGCGCSSTGALGLFWLGLLGLGAAVRRRG
jgi:hypothetical protein